MIFTTTTTSSEATIIKNCMDKYSS
jgi:hypothetical protein